DRNVTGVQTCALPIWVRVPRRETERAMTVLGELICRPALDMAEIDREREVIIEEIRGYLDDPGEYAQILFQQAMFGPGSLGREKIGRASCRERVGGTE